ncbi:uncharacterized protein I303_105687 [Kwoniella dejecticola CBS 10117]|uniref:Uncharacterized protein n=1 Tax=Kwoniella dejecticola CBS 10117 TaxID=1296121 RepID=A0A1A6A058_9TREE|nr:uncharacterized protein I303_05709 [Kwoniella dejecticola CBS 10117]OBR83431.1 hypothetical protein I303_05709 [Kwoniella dejecticola CBS 10117]
MKEGYKTRASIITAQHDQRIPTYIPYQPTYKDHPYPFNWRTLFQMHTENSRGSLPARAAHRLASLASSSAGPLQSISAEEDDGTSRAMTSDTVQQDDTADQTPTGFRFVPYKFDRGRPSEAGTLDIDLASIRNADTNELLYKCSRRPLDSQTSAHCPLRHAVREIDTNLSTTIDGFQDHALPREGDATTHFDRLKREVTDVMADVKFRYPDVNFRLNTDTRTLSKGLASESPIESVEFVRARPIVTQSIVSDYHPPSGHIRGILNLGSSTLPDYFLRNRRSNSALRTLAQRVDALRHADVQVFQGWMTSVSGWANDE